MVELSTGSIASGGNNSWQEAYHNYLRVNLWGATIPVFDTKG